MWRKSLMSADTNRSRIQQRRPAANLLINPFWTAVAAKDRQKSTRLLTLLGVLAWSTVTARCPSVRLSVRPIYRPLHQRAAGLLLWARRSGDNDRLLRGASGRLVIHIHSSTALSNKRQQYRVFSDVGSWTQSCYFCSLWRGTPLTPVCLFPSLSIVLLAR